MRSYIVRRLLLIIPTLVLVTIIVFATIRMIPGNVIDLMVSEMEYYSEMDVLKLQQALGLDLPIHVQYWNWMERIIFHGDLGRSLLQGTPVVDEIISRFPVSFELGIMSILIGQMIALPIGIYSAIRQDTAGDYISRTFAIICISVPSFWLGTVVMVFPSVWWQWSPSVEYVPFTQNMLGNLGQFLIPAVIMGMVMSGTTMRMTRTMMLEVLRQDYIRTAWSKGLTERTIIVRHALKNALIPVVTVIGLQVPILIGGSVIMEQIFCLPGIGRLTVEVITKRDYTVLSGINLFMALFMILANLAVDLTYALLDPRVHYK